MRRTGLLLGVLLVLAGCGQKGPLYLPDKNRSVVTTPAAPATPSATAPGSPAAAKKPTDTEPDPAAPAAPPATPK